MDEETGRGSKPSSIKPPMIKPPMAVPPQSMPRASQSPMQSPAMSRSPEAPENKSNKLVIVINFILLAALIVGLAILAYRWLR